MDRVWRYIDDVKSGRRVAGEMERLAVQRFLSDLERQDSSDFPYYFSEESAQFFLDASKAYPLTKGKKAGQPFELLDWQAFFIANLYGWKRSEDDCRRFNKFYIKVARKNGKTELLYLLGMYAITIDGIHGGEVYWAATKRDQAKIGWDRMRMGIDLLIKSSSYFKKHVNYYRSTLKIFNTGNQMIVAPLGRDSNTDDGLSPYYSFIDEYHAHPTSGMLDILESGTGAYDEPIVGIITTAGFNTGSPCKQLEDKYKRVLKGELPGDEIFIQIFDLDDGDDWMDEHCWPKANPSLGGGAVNMRFLKSEFKKAKLEGASKEISFKTKNLNIWTNTASSWISTDKWRELTVNDEDIDLSSMRCFAGLDYAQTQDTTCLCLVFVGDDKCFVKPFFWIPETPAKDKQKFDKVPYIDWAKDKHITLIRGEVNDPDFLMKDLLTIFSIYGVEAMAYDRWKLTDLVRKMGDEGVTCLPFGQGFASMSYPTKEVERLILAEKLLNDGNPVMEWQMGNVMLSIDPAENVKIDKRKSTHKVDGPVALVMAYGCYLAITSNESEKTEELIYI